MPELSFVLPHWLYWSGLLLFPLLAFWLVRRHKARAEHRPVSVPLGYFLLVTGGFIGVHRLYLKSRWAAAFAAAFVAILVLNVEVRTARDQVSASQNAVDLTDMKIDRAERSVEKYQRRLERRDSERNRERLAEARQRIDTGRVEREQLQRESVASIERLETWTTAARSLGLLLLLGILIDAALMPRLVRRRNELEQQVPGEGFHCPVVEQEHDDSREPLLFNRLVSRLNALAGEFVAYWSLLAVFVYYYEVIARYVFNSPTNWAHEGMFLMFGMQYLIAGGFCLRENAHVRVDVIYSQLSLRARAVLDLITSVFFFIFVLTLLATGWIFFHDAFEIGEVSFTEWGIQYWPVKFALPLGAVLLLLQGVSQLLKDIAVLRKPQSAELEAHARPEG